MHDIETPLNILYLTTPGPYTKDARLVYLARSAMLPEVTVCLSWDQMLSSVAHCIGDTLVVFDTWYLIKERLSAEEITGMLCSVFKCGTADTASRIKFALYSDTKIQSVEVKTLKSSDIIGIIPGPTQATLERRIEIIDTIAGMKQCWPKELIDGAAKKAEVDNSEIHLTARQSQVLSLVCNRGLSNKKIASLLKISESTVKIHVSAILKEYGVRNRTQLALAARESLHA